MGKLKEKFAEKAGIESTDVTPVRSNDLSLEECFSALEKYGNPTLRKDNGEWSCYLSVFVTGKGTEFKVRSDWKHKTHAEAANLCFTRLTAELKRIKETR